MYPVRACYECYRTSTVCRILLGGLCALGGIFILTLPIPIVVNSFASYYKNRLWRNEVRNVNVQHNDSLRLSMEYCRTYPADRY